MKDLIPKGHRKQFEKGWTQQELAKKVGTTKRIISELEDADYNIGIGLLYRLLNVLEINILFKDYEKQNG